MTDAEYARGILVGEGENMSHYIVWHNPRCSKSRAARDELADLGDDVTLRLYREDPPSVAELITVLAKLDLDPWDITRMGEPAAAELGLAGWPRDEASRDRWIAALAAEPSLLQRPIVIAGDRAVVAREPGWRDRLDGPPGPAALPPTSQRVDPPVLPPAVFRRTSAGCHSFGPAAGAGRDGAVVGRRPDGPDRFGSSLAAIPSTPTGSVPVDAAPAIIGRFRVDRPGSAAPRTGSGR